MKNIIHLTCGCIDIQPGHIVVGGPVVCHRHGVVGIVSQSWSEKK